MRLLATALDGTALAPGGVVRPAVRAAFDRAREAGIDVVVATGRPPRFAHRAAVELGAPGHAVCANGSVPYDVATETLVDVRPLDAAVGPIVERLRDAAPGVAFAAEWDLTFAFEARFEAAIPEKPDDPPLVDDILDIDAATLHKLLAVHPGMSGPALWRLADAVLDGLAAPSHSGLGFVEIAGHGVNKATALERLCAERGIDVAEVAAVGDNLNDLEMLRWAGRSFAMGGSSPDVVAAADEVVSDHHRDGAAEVVARLLA